MLTTGRKKFAALAFAVVATIAGSSLATEYYVDSLSGSDANDGMTESTAWKSLDKVNDADIKGGDAVHFRRGRVWRGTLRPKSGEPDAPTRYDAYGEGEKPRVMYSADLSDPELWEQVDEELWATKEVKYVDVDSSDETKLFAAGDWHIYTEEEASGTCKKREFDDIGGAKGYRVICESPGTRATHFQLTTEGFPVRKDRLVALRVKARAGKPISLNPTLMMKGKPWSSYGKCVVGSGPLEPRWREFDLVFHTTQDAEDGRITFFLGDTLSKDWWFDFVILGAREVEASGAWLDADVGNIVYSWRGVIKQSENSATKVFHPTYKGWEICGFKKWTLDDLKLFGDFWYDGEKGRVYVKDNQNPGRRYFSIEAPMKGNCCRIENGRDVIVEDLAFTHTGAHGVSAARCERTTIRNCDFHWIGGSDLYGGGGAGKRVRYGNGVEFWDGLVDCTVDGCRFTEVYDTATTTQGPEKDVARNLTIRNCTMIRCEQSFEIWFTHPETIVENCVFEDNLCVDSGRGWSHVQRPDKRGTPLLAYSLDAAKVDVTVRHNVFYDTSQEFIAFWHDRIGDYKINDNVYWVAKAYHEAGDKYFHYNIKNGAPGKTFDEYRAETGHDADSRWVEPIFRDYSRDDLQILNKSEIFDWRTK